MKSKTSANIIQAFSDYAKTNNKDLINKISEDELEVALSEFNISEFQSPLYLDIESRLNKIREQKWANKAVRDKWRARLFGLIGFVMGALVTLIFVKNK